MGKVQMLEQADPAFWPEALATLTADLLGWWGMPTLTRRRDPNVRQECWRVQFGDVVVSTIAQCVGNPDAAPRWQWRCGFYPDSRPVKCSSGTAAGFEKTRAG